MDDRKLLLIDDDPAFLRAMSRSLSRLGYAVIPAETLASARESLKVMRPELAIVDLHLGEENGLDILKDIAVYSPDTKPIVLSGYANVPSAVASIKKGAVDCLAKPVDLDILNHALKRALGEFSEPPAHSVQPNAIRLKHILAHFEKADRNVSRTARRLGMHRRTLQRILANSGMQTEDRQDEVSGSRFGRLRRLLRVWSGNYAT